ncbi:MAG TPA: hypothetical protein VK551_10155, partial [Thermodesulfobacteriota bacterium]|nr:hypothetical protein [Thermodesulfobacteriota bacterium]
LLKSTHFVKIWWTKIEEDRVVRLHGPVSRPPASPQAGAPKRRRGRRGPPPILIDWGWLTLIKYQCINDLITSPLDAPSLCQGGPVRKVKLSAPSYIYPLLVFPFLPFTTKPCGFDISKKYF